MKVSLGSTSNPDFPRDSQIGKIIQNHFVEVDSLLDAQTKCLQFIEDNDLGGGNWIGGSVFDSKKKIAQISYNGRIHNESN